jgi:hypothetical protein
MRSFLRVRATFQSDVQNLPLNTPRKWVVGGMMGSGKTTFAKSIAKTLQVRHIHIDEYESSQAVLDAVRTAIGDGWIAEANPWQIPEELGAEAEVVIFLDYDNIVNYVRLLSRGIKEWKEEQYSWDGFTNSVVGRAIKDLGRIVYLHGANNRRGWRENGLLPGVGADSPKYIRCISPGELKRVENLIRKSLHHSSATELPGSD